MSEVKHASGPWGTARMQSGAAGITGRGDGVCKLMLTYAHAVAIDAQGIQRMYKLEWKDFPVDAVSGRAQTAATAPPSPPPLSYPEFHQLAAAQVLKYCPKAKLITDCSADRFLLWLEHAGCKANCAVCPDGMSPETLIASTCIEFRNAVAARELA